MSDGPRQKPPPPPPAAFRQRQAGCQSPAPSSEGILAGPNAASAKLVERLRALLPPSSMQSLAVDSQGRIFVDKSQIGVLEAGRMLIEYGPLFSRIKITPAMRVMVQAHNMALFIEVTESESCICAGDRIGQKKIYSRIS